MSEERFLVTGAAGCIGTWVVRQLVSEGCSVVSLDIAEDPKRWRLVMSDAEIARVGQVRADITDLTQVERALDEHRTTHVIHLAALQVPFCRADPPLAIARPAERDRRGTARPSPVAAVGSEPERLSASKGRHR